MSKNNSFICIATCVIMLLSGCSLTQSSRIKSATVGAATGGAVGAAIGAPGGGVGVGAGAGVGAAGGALTGLILGGKSNVNTAPQPNSLRPLYYPTIPPPPPPVPPTIEK